MEILLMEVVISISKVQAVIIVISMSILLDTVFIRKGLRGEGP